MQKILEKLLHISVAEKELEDINQLPLFLQSGYELKLYDIAGEPVLFAKSKEQVPFPTLKKHWKKFQELMEMPCVIYDNRYSRYSRKRMIELGIPFVFDEDNVYLPFLGIALRKTRETTLPEISHFSPFTQKLVLMAIYHNWTQKTCKELSEEMNVSRITVNRALVELQALDLPLTFVQGKTRYFKSEKTPREVYEMCLDFMINPVAKSYRLACIPENLSVKGEMSALAEYSLISDNPFPTFAVDWKEARNLQLDDYQKSNKFDIPSCIIHVLRYKIVMHQAIDPISAILCLNDKERMDPRVEQSIEETLEGIWNKNV